MMKKIYNTMPELESYSEVERQQVWKECSKKALLHQPVAWFGWIVLFAGLALDSRFLDGGLIDNVICGAIGGVLAIPFFIYAGKKEVRKKLAA